MQYQEEFASGTGGGEQEGGGSCGGISLYLFGNGRYCDRIRLVVAVLLIFSFITVRGVDECCGTVLSWVLRYGPDLVGDLAVSLHFI